MYFKVWRTLSINGVFLSLIYKLFIILLSLSSSLLCFAPPCQCLFGSLSVHNLNFSTAKLNLRSENTPYFYCFFCDNCKMVFRVESANHSLRHALPDSVLLRSGWVGSWVGCMPQISSDLFLWSSLFFSSFVLFLLLACSFITSHYVWL